MDGVGIRYEADPRHVQIIIKEMLQNTGAQGKTAVTLGVRERTDAEEEVLEQIEELKRKAGGKTGKEEKEESGQRKAEIINIDRLRLLGISLRRTELMCSSLFRKLQEGQATQEKPIGRSSSD